MPESRFAELDVAPIRANLRQPRQVFDEDSLGELTHSIREFGVLQPVVVRPASSDGSYELVMGERRLRAAIAAGLTRIPAIVRDTADDAMLRDALLENLHRTGLNPLEEAAAYQQLLDDFGVTHEELALRIGRSRSQVSNTIRLMNLSIRCAAGRCWRDLRRPCARAACAGRSGRPGRARGTDRGRRPVGTSDRGNRGDGGP